MQALLKPLLELAEYEDIVKKKKEADRKSVGRERVF